MMRLYSSTSRASVMARRKLLSLNGACPCCITKPVVVTAGDKTMLKDLLRPVAVEGVAVETSPVPALRALSRCTGSVITRNTSESRYGRGAFQYVGLRTSVIWLSRVHDCKRYGPAPIGRP